MKKIAIFFFAALAQAASAQLVITPGAQLYVNGNAQLTLQNTNLVNNGNFTAGTGTVSFTGNTRSTISGSQPVQFYQLEINKSGGNSILLQRAIDVTHQVNFTDGFIDLNGNNINLGTSGLLIGEQEASRIIGANGGQVLFNTVLNAPSAANPGNIGAIITSSQNMGNVIIARGHQSQVNAAGAGNSILRYYYISPTNNSGLNATLRAQYFDGELNGIPESSLVFWSSPNSTTWTNEGASSNNTTLNYVMKTGIASFSTWTLSSLANALPVQFISFNARCEGSVVVLKWKTAQEQNSSHFDIERSLDNTNWTVIGNTTAMGNSSSPTSYFFTDAQPVSNCNYRIAQYDADGKIQYTNALKSNCDFPENAFVFWPNPVRDVVFINITAGSSTPAMIKVYDNKGALMKIQKENLLKGNNRLHVDIKNFANGIYQFTIEWNNGQVFKTMQVFKE